MSFNSSLINYWRGRGVSSVKWSQKQLGMAARNSSAREQAHTGVTVEGAPPQRQSEPGYSGADRADAGPAR